MGKDRAKFYFWITDGYKVYPKVIPDGDQIISKTSMTRVEGENSRNRPTREIFQIRRKS
jgi:IS1 family transposase